MQTTAIKSGYTIAYRLVDPSLLLLVKVELIVIAEVGLDSLFFI